MNRRGAMIQKVRAVALIACLALASVSAYAGRDGRTTVEGQLIAVSQDFNGVRNTTAARVIVRVGAEHSVRVTGENRALDRLFVEVDEGVLKIRRPWRPWNPATYLPFESDREVLVEVTMPELNSVTLTGSGSAMVEGMIRTDRLDLRTTGPGRISATGDVHVLDVSITGSGDIDFRGTADEATVSLTGPGDLYLDLDAGRIEARTTGSGDIILLGSARTLALKIRDGGRFDGEHFITDTAEITISGSADALLQVRRELDARLTGGGDIRLVGRAPTIVATTTGSGRVITESE